MIEIIYVVGKTYSNEVNLNVNLATSNVTICRLKYLRDTRSEKDLNFTKKTLETDIYCDFDTMISCPILYVDRFRYIPD